MAKPNQNEIKDNTTSVKKVTTTPNKKASTPTKSTPAKSTPVKPTPTKDNTKDNNKVESTTPVKSTPTKDNNKKTNNNNNNNSNNNNKRKEPETKDTKESTTPTKPIATNQSNNKSPNTNTNNDNNKNVNKDNKKQPQQKKQKTESKSTPTPSTKEEPKQTTTTVTPPATTTTTTEVKSTPTFSIFDSLKKLDTQPVSTTTATNNNKNNKKESSSPSTSTTTTTNKITKDNNESLLKAFSTSNEYNEPNIKEINDKVESVLKEIKDNSPKEQERKLQKEKTKKLKESEKQREKQNPRTVFVSNIKLENANEKDIKLKFIEFGKIESVRFRSIPISSVDANRKETFIKKQFHDKRDTCNAYIVYSTEESAKKAVESMNGKELYGKHIRVDLASHKPSKESDAKCVFVGNVPYEIEEEELFLLFNSTFGNVLNVRIVRDQHTNIGKGFGYVNFNTEEAAKSAIDMKSVDIGKRTIRIFPTKANPKSGKTIKEKKKIEKRNPNKRVENSKSQSK